MTDHRAEPKHGPLGRAWLFDRCAECDRIITRISSTGHLGKWRHLR